MRTDSIVVKPPGLDFDAGLLERQEEVLVQAFVATLAIKAFDEGILDWFARPNELQLDATPMRPFIDRSAAKLRAIVRYDGYRIAAIHRDLIESCRHISTGEAAAHFDRQAFSRPVIHDG